MSETATVVPIAAAKENRIRKLSLLAYGASGVGKTTQFRYFSKYVWEKYQLKSRFICLDGGSLWECVQDYVDEGFVIPLQIPVTSEYNPFAVMRKIGRGEWPENNLINMPTAVKSGNTVQWKTNTKWNPLTAKEAATLGLIGIDSLTGYSSALLFDMSVKNIRKGSDSGGGAREEEGELAGSNTISHYGDVQNEVKNLLNSIVALPVPFAYFTALEDGGLENTTGSKRPVFGPQIAGSAATGEIPKLVTNCFHLTADGAGTARTVKAWFDEHEDSTLPPKMKWKAKCSSLLPMQKMEFQKKNPGGFFPLDPRKGIRDFLDFRDWANEALKE